MMNKPKSPNSWITKPTDWLSDRDIDQVENFNQKKNEFSYTQPTF